MKPKRSKYLVGIVIGALLQLSPLAAFFATKGDMDRAFEATSSSGIGDPAALSRHIDSVLFYTAAGSLGFLCGLALFIISIVLFLRVGSTAQKPIA